MMKTAFVCCLLLLGVPTPSQGLSQNIKDEVCVDVAHGLIHEADGWACGAAATAITGLIDAACEPCAALDWFIDKAISYACGVIVDKLEADVDLTPAGVCSDIGYRRRRDESNGTRSESLIFANWTSAHTARWKQRRGRRMHAAGTPVAVFPDGKLGYCFQNDDAGAYTCLEDAGDASLGNQVAVRSAAGQAYATRMTQLQVASGPAPSSSSSTGSGSLVTIVVLGAAFVVCAVYAVQLNRKVSKLEEIARNPYRALGADDTQLTEYAAASSA